MNSLSTRPPELSVTGQRVLSRLRHEWSQNRGVNQTITIRKPPPSWPRTWNTQIANLSTQDLSTTSNQPHDRISRPRTALATTSKRYSDDLDPIQERVNNYVTSHFSQSFTDDDHERQHEDENTQSHNTERTLLSINSAPIHEKVNNYLSTHVFPQPVTGQHYKRKHDGNDRFDNEQLQSKRNPQQIRIYPPRDASNDTFKSPFPQEFSNFNASSVRLRQTQMSVLLFDEEDDIFSSPSQPFNNMMTKEDRNRHSEQENRYGLTTNPRDGRKKCNGNADTGFEINDESGTGTREEARLNNDSGHRHTGLKNNIRYQFENEHNVADDEILTFDPVADGRPTEANWDNYDIQDEINRRVDPMIKSQNSFIFSPRIETTPSWTKQFTEFKSRPHVSLEYPSKNDSNGRSVYFENGQQSSERINCEKSVNNTPDGTYDQLEYLSKKYGNFTPLPSQNSDCQGQKPYDYYNQPSTSKHSYSVMPNTGYHNEVLEKQCSNLPSSNSTNRHNSDLETETNSQDYLIRNLETPNFDLLPSFEDIFDDSQDSSGPDFDTNNADDNVPKTGKNQINNKPFQPLKSSDFIRTVQDVQLKQSATETPPSFKALASIERTRSDNFDDDPNKTTLETNMFFTKTLNQREVKPANLIEKYKSSIVASINITSERSRDLPIIPNVDSKLTDIPNKHSNSKRDHHKNPNLKVSGSSGYIFKTPALKRPVIIQQENGSSMKYQIPFDNSDSLTKRNSVHNERQKEISIPKSLLVPSLLVSDFGKNEVNNLVTSSTKNRSTHLQCSGDREEKGMKNGEPLSEKDCKEEKKKGCSTDRTILPPKMNEPVRKIPEMFLKNKPRKNSKQSSLEDTNMNNSRMDAGIDHASGRSEKFNVIILNDQTVADIEKTVPLSDLKEVVITIMYREGYSQLNLPVSPSKSVACSPSGLMIGLTSNADNTTYCYMGLATKQWQNQATPKMFLSGLFACLCPKICVDAQAMFMFLVDKFGFHLREVVTQCVLIDPVVGCWLLDPDYPPNNFTDVTNLLLGKQVPSGVEDRKGKVCQQLGLLSAAVEQLKRKLEEQGLWQLFLHLEMRIVPILAVMELRGIRVDCTKLRETGGILEKRIKYLENAAHKAAGKSFQLNSPQQLRAILYDELELDRKNGIVIKETVSLGAKSTAEAMLRRLVSLHPLPGIILEYRHLQKLKSTYVDAILQHVRDNCIYTSWEQTAAATGRLSSSNPNLQAVPKQPVSSLTNSDQANQGTDERDHYLDGRDRKSLGPEFGPLSLRSAYVPRPNCSFLAADFQHVEFRLFAHFAQDAGLLQVFKQPGDIFMALAERWLGKSGKVPGPLDREKTKRIVYSVMYGAGPGKLAEFLQVTPVEALTIINSFVGMFPALRSFPRRVIAQCRLQGFLSSLSGRRRLFPKINSHVNAVRAHSERQAINFVIQGSAADICKAAMLQTEQCLLDQPGLEPRLLLQIHDELMWEVPNDQLEQVKEIVRRTMENTSALCGNMMNLSLPLPVSITSGQNWGEMTP